jgi:hypothetical protein
MKRPLSEVNDAGLEEVEVSAAVDRGKAITASIAALSLDTPLANASTRLRRAQEIQASRSASAFPGLGLLSSR